MKYFGAKITRVKFSSYALVVTLALSVISVHAQDHSGEILFADPFGRLLIINADGTGQTILTTGGTVRDFNPVYSPDGSKIVFARNTTFGTSIFVMNADGSNPVALTPVSQNFSGYSHPSWSPDGKKIVFASDRNGTRKLEIFVINIDGTGLTQLTTNVQLTTDGQGPVYSNDFEPSWSPDGLSIAFASNRIALNNIEVYVMNADGSNQTRLSTHNGDDRGPTWSPDSKKIAFFGNSENFFGINIMNRDGTNVVNTTGDGRYPAWGPDGARLAILRGDPNNNFQAGIWTINTDGSNAFKVTNNNFDCRDPSWAPSSSPSLPTATISGHVMDGSGMPVGGATLALTGTFNRTTQSDSTGAYAFVGLAAGNYSITISKPGFGFTPPSFNFNNLTSDQMANFSAFPVFSISGQVVGLGGNIISVSLSGSQTRSVLTDPSGNYAFDSVPAGGNYTVAINNKIWNITPGSYTFNNLSSNQTANFSAAIASYSISGRITRLGQPLPGVTVALENGTGFTPPTVMTDANGQYSFTNVRAGGNYTIRPTAANYLFDPQTQGFTALDGNKTADFIALSANHLLFNTRYVFGGASNNCNLVLNVLRGGNAQGVGPITVRYATSDGSATAGSDYTAVAGTLNFPEGTFSQTVTIPLLAGPNTGLPRTFLVTLSNPTGEVDLGDPSSVTVVLTDSAPSSSLVLATQPNTNRAVALNASNLLAEPFSLLTPINFSQDTKTRVSFFVSGVQFNACQGTNALFFSGMDSQQHSFSGTVEEVVKLPGTNPYLQLTIPLPQGFITGDWTISFSLGNLTTNTAHFSTRQ
jgi:TolB protein